MYHTGYGRVRLVEGIILIVLGVLTLVRPDMVYTGAVFLYGILAISVGVIDIVAYARQEAFTGFGSTLALVAGILSVMTGCMLLRHQGAGKKVLLVLFAVWFIAHCISRLTRLNYIRFAYGNFRYWFTLIINVAGIVLGFLMLMETSLTFVTLSGILGVYLILLGIDSVWPGNSEEGIL